MRRHYSNTYTMLSPIIGKETRQVLDDVISDMADVLAERTVGFDRGRFVAACKNQGDQYGRS